MSRVRPLTSVKGLTSRNFVAFFYQGDRPLFIATIRPTMFILISSTSPIARLSINFRRTSRVNRRSTMDLHVFRYLSRLFTCLVVVRFIRTRCSDPFTNGKDNGLLSIRRPMETYSSLLSRVHVLTRSIFPGRRVPLKGVTKHSTNFRFLSHFIKREVR